eukprot:17006-Heterococcus_DN1.PRE.2
MAIYHHSQLDCMLVSSVNHNAGRCSCAVHHTSARGMLRQATVASGSVLSMRQQSLLALAANY